MCNGLTCFAATLGPWPFLQPLLAAAPCSCFYRRQLLRLRALRDSGAVCRGGIGAAAAEGPQLSGHTDHQHIAGYSSNYGDHNHCQGRKNESEYSRG